MKEMLRQSMEARAQLEAQLEVQTHQPDMATVSSLGTHHRHRHHYLCRHHHCWPLLITVRIRFPPPSPPLPSVAADDDVFAVPLMMTTPLLCH
jgi:hypothetical protein